MESARVGKRGAIVVPARLRKRFGIEEGSLVTAEERDVGILIRPAVLIPIERYGPQQPVVASGSSYVEAHIPGRDA